MIISILIIIVTCLVIWKASELLEAGSADIGKYFQLSEATVGATLMAVSSSFAEFCTVFIGLVVYSSFEVGVGAIAGSALFNLLIPAIVVHILGAQKTSPEVVHRDGGIYFVVVTLMIAAFWFAPATQSGGAMHMVPWWIGLIAVVLYAAYVIYMIKTGKKSEDSDVKEKENVDLRKAIGKMALGMIGVGIACHFLVGAALEVFVNNLGLSAMTAGVTVLAAATSIPDALVSIFAARKGDADGAFSNAFGSNTFDILVCIGLPVLLMGGIEINWAGSWKILVILFGSTIIALGFMRTRWTLHRWEACVMVSGYALFCGAAVTGLL